MKSLNELTALVATDWAARDHLWTTQETVERSLLLFAQVILTLAAQAADDELESTGHDDVAGDTPMQITLTATARTLTLDTPDGSVPVRIWIGQTDSGIGVDAYIASVEPQDVNDARRFEDELLAATRET